MGQFRLCAANSIGRGRCGLRLPQCYTSYCPSQLQIVNLSATEGQRCVRVRSPGTQSSLLWCPLRPFRKVLSILLTMDASRSMAEDIEFSAAPHCANSTRPISIRSSALFMIVARRGLKSSALPPLLTSPQGTLEHRHLGTKSSTQLFFNVHEVQYYWPDRVRFE